mmetsp:Transcript_18493/g.27412  ORF Transcript_18493/g.27412 Transcript_18493/m.27412 type:complete len:315 (+) Transcript_18493:43-987(+)
MTTMITTSSNNNHPSFLLRLHLLLSKAPEFGIEHIVSWHSSGRKFIIHKQNEFASTTILSEIFYLSNYGSFCQKLKAYGFEKDTTMAASNDDPEDQAVVYSHVNFREDNPKACQTIILANHEIKSHFEAARNKSRISLKALLAHCSNTEVPGNDSEESVHHSNISTVATIGNASTKGSGRDPQRPLFSPSTLQMCEIAKKHLCDSAVSSTPGPELHSIIANGSFLDATERRNQQSGIVGDSHKRTTSLSIASSSPSLQDEPSSPQSLQDMRMRILNPLPRLRDTWKANILGSAPVAPVRNISTKADSSSPLLDP